MTNIAPAQEDNRERVPEDVARAAGQVGVGGVESDQERENRYAHLFRRETPRESEMLDAAEKEADAIAAANDNYRGSAANSKPLNQFLSVQRAVADSEAARGLRPTTSMPPNPDRVNAIRERENIR